MLNLALPGNPRYQPQELKGIFGYDVFAGVLVEVELATMRTLGELGIISQAELCLLTPEIERQLLAITTTEMDRVEREVTQHDIRALVRLIQEIIPLSLRRWVHVPLTSYDVIDTARALQFRRAHDAVIRPKTKEVVRILCKKATEFAATVQIGRTHGQHALPITVGFWLATILHRVLHNARQTDVFAAGLRGKISGAVGAYNAQVALGMSRDKNGRTFEEAVLAHLGLLPAPISTQILPPEPLSYYLFSCGLLSASLGQLGTDCRQLMRTEISEICEPFAKGQVGSSTMAHKRNPINFESLVGAWEGARAETGKVLSLLVSEHQRDLTGSSVARDLPVIIVKLVCQLNTLLRPNKSGISFLERVSVDTDSCSRNLSMQGDLVLAEPLYIALQMAGYAGDAHEFVNQHAVEVARRKRISLVEVIQNAAEKNKELSAAWQSIPKEVRDILGSPSRYIGCAVEKTKEICEAAKEYLDRD
ncbi:MAG: hypothetical protein HYU35_02740 [Parcubacteria group bacterium]|nr:hypothetical protein [Parcubacteria group bacterium]